MGSSDQRSSHRRSHADLRLASTFSCRQRCMMFAEITYRESGKHAFAEFLLRYLPTFGHGKDNCRLDASRSAGGGRYNEVAASVLRGCGDSSCREHAKCAIGSKLLVLGTLEYRRRFAMQLDRAREHTSFRHTQPRLHRRKHRGDDLVDKGIYLISSLARDRHFVSKHYLSDSHLVLIGMSSKFCHCLERVFRRTFLRRRI